MKCPSTYHCPVEATLELIGGKYKALILFHLRPPLQRASPPDSTGDTENADPAAARAGNGRFVKPHRLSCYSPKGGVSAHSFWGNDLTGFGGYVQLGIRLFEQIRQQGPFFRGYQYRNAD